MTGLVQIEQAVFLLEKARTLDEITHIHSMAAAAEEYARAEKLGTEAERYAREIRTRAARKAGEVLRVMAATDDRLRQGQTQAKVIISNATTSSPKTLSELGITPDQSSRWQRIAAVSEPEFEEAVSMGRGETSIARGERYRSPAHLTTKRDPPTGLQSLRGLQQAAIQLQGLAEALEGQLLGEWTQLYGLAEADQFFEILEESLPIVSARVKRILRERRESTSDTERVG